MLLRDWLVEHGWQHFISGPCIYFFRAGTIFAMIALYVDDIPAACNDATWLTSFKARLGATFNIKNLGDLSQLHDMHITCDMYACTISLHQPKYLMRDILAKHCMTDCKHRPCLWTHAACLASRTWTPPPLGDRKGRLPQPTWQPRVCGWLHAP
jgi:hypothetical protein